MREVISVSVGIFSVVTAGRIKDKIIKHCVQYGVRYNIDNKHKSFGEKLIVVLDGDKEDVELVKKLLKTDFKIKNI